MKKLFIVNGASGVGKTTAVKNVRKNNPEGIEFLFFDKIGVPSTEEMNEKFGGPEEWQRQATQTWIKKIKDEVLKSKDAVLDGQIRPGFIDEACKKENITNYEVILFDCSDGERTKRLIDRGQGNLANEGMMNWAKYLIKESILRKYTIVDNTDFTQEQSANALRKILGI